MKITKNLLKQLILEIVKHYKDDPRFPITVDRPKAKSIITDEEFQNAFIPLIGFSQLKKNEELYISLNQLIRSLFNLVNTSPKKAAASFNAEYAESGAKFNSEKIGKILNILKTYKNTKEIIDRLDYLGLLDKLAQYTPDPDAEFEKKTANIKGPIREKRKVSLKYKCN